MKKIGLFMLLVMSMTGTAVAQFGALDPAFNPSGAGTYGDVYTVAALPDGKILVGGVYEYYQMIPKKNLVRLNQDGSLDNTFPVQFNSTIMEVVVLPDGKILVAGSITACITSSGTVAANGIARLNADGTFDNTFNVGGAGMSQPLITSGIAKINSMVVLSSGKILIGGDFKKYNGTTVNGIARLNADGTLDNTFNPGIGAADNTFVDAVAVQADNKVIIGGTFTTFNGAPAGHLIRLNADGSIDNTFNTGGSGLNGGYITVYNMKMQPDGKAIVGGSFTSYNGIPIGNLMRLNTDGSVDNTFNTVGSGPSDQVFDVILLPDNRILISGMSSYNGTGTGKIACLNADGLLDNTFNTGGTGANDLVFSIAPAIDDKLIIGGVFGSYNGTTMERVARLSMVCTPVTGTDVQVACGSYTWINGVIYTQSNTTATDTIVGGAANGCDSIVTLNLTINQPATGTDVQTACGSYTWINGVIYTQSNMTATDTIVGGAANGCDSIVTLNLTINQPTTGTDVQTACGTYTWINGVTYNTSNNTATYTIVGGAANGCDSVVTLNLTIQVVNTSVTIQDATMGALLTGASYQWINCSTNTLISGATARTYTATTNGSYAVIITQNSCSDTSGCLQVTHLGLEEIAGWNTVLYPNPSTGAFTIYWGTEVGEMTIEITDVTGKPVYRSVVSGTVSQLVDMKEATGIYYATLSNGTQRQVIKVIRD